VIICHSATDDTGRSVLTVKQKAMEEKKEFKAQAAIEVIDFGPLKITGNFQLKDLKREKEESPGEIWLCRCGRSATKPYCDGSHKK